MIPVIEPDQEVNGMPLVRGGVALGCWFTPGTSASSTVLRPCRFSGRDMILRVASIIAGDARLAEKRQVSW